MIVRGSFIGHGDYIAHVIAEMAHLSVTSSNSLRRSSPSERKRSQSLGRLGDLVEDFYQYKELNRHVKRKNEASSTYWQDRIWHVRTDSNSPKLSGRTTPNGTLLRAKSSYKVSEATTTPPHETGSIGGQYAHSEGAWLRDRCAQGAGMSTARPSSFSTQMHQRPKPHVNQPPDLMFFSTETPRRPHSSYDLKVTTGTSVCEASSYR